MMMVLTTLIMFAGLAYDMGMVFNAHREATNIAGAAARAGANVVSVDALYGGDAKIDAAGEQRARDRIPAHATELKIEISDDETRIDVEVEVTHQAKILSIFGFGAMNISGEASAQIANEAS